MRFLDTIARLLGCSVEQAEQALRHDEANVKRVLNRRGALSALGSLVASPLIPEPPSVVYSFGKPDHGWNTEDIWQDFGGKVGGAWGQVYAAMQLQVQLQVGMAGIIYAAVEASR